MPLALRLYAQFADRTTLANVFAVVERCRRDLAAGDTPGAAERVEQVARQRLSRLLEAPASAPNLPA
jgi:hypothetical protein